MLKAMYRKARKFFSTNFCSAKKCQGLPISTIIIIILVIIVLVAVGIFFFTQFGAGAGQASTGTGVAGTGITNLTKEASGVI